MLWKVDVVIVTLSENQHAVASVVKETKKKKKNFNFLLLYDISSFSHYRCYVPHVIFLNVIPGDVILHTYVT